MNFGKTTTLLRPVTGKQGLAQNLQIPLLEKAPEGYVDEAYITVLLQENERFDFEASWNPNPGDRTTWVSKTEKVYGLRFVGCSHLPSDWLQSGMQYDVHIELLNEDQLAFARVFTDRVVNAASGTVQMRYIGGFNVTRKPSASGRFTFVASPEMKATVTAVAIGLLHGGRVPDAKGPEELESMEQLLQGYLRETNRLSRFGGAPFAGGGASAASFLSPPPTAGALGEVEQFNE